MFGLRKSKVFPHAQAGSVSRLILPQREFISDLYDLLEKGSGYSGYILLNGSSTALFMEFKHIWVKYL